MQCGTASVLSQIASLSSIFCGKQALNGDFSWLPTKIMLTEDKTVSCTEFDCAPCKVQFKLFWRAVVKCGSRSSLPSSNMNG